MDENQANLEDEKNNIGNDFQQVFGWFLIVNRIAGNDFTKHEYIYQKKITEVLNQLNYLIAYDKEQERLQKKAQRKG